MMKGHLVELLETVVKPDVFIVQEMHYHLISAGSIVFVGGEWRKWLNARRQ